MTDEEIRAALLDAKASGTFAPFPVADHVVVSRDRVTGDLDEIDAWVRKNGRIKEWPGYESRPFGGGPWQRGPSTPPSLWYVVPASALGL